MSTSESNTHANSPDRFEKISTAIDQLLQQMIEQQQTKALNRARACIPHLTGDDILNPHDYSQLNLDPIFNYEEGLAAGLMAAQIAIRAEINRI
jgi:hypothetical protein